MTTLLVDVGLPVVRSVDGVISPGLAGRYRDTLVRVHGHWLIAQHAAEPMSDIEGTNEGTV